MAITSSKICGKDHLVTFFCCLGALGNIFAWLGLSLMNWNVCKMKWVPLNFNSLSWLWLNVAVLGGTNCVLNSIKISLVALISLAFLVISSGVLITFV